jgi:hypothetical protein
VATKSDGLLVKTMKKCPARRPSFFPYESLREVEGGMTIR